MNNFPEWATIGTGKCDRYGRARWEKRAAAARNGKMCRHADIVCFNGISNCHPSPIGKLCEQRLPFSLILVRLTFRQNHPKIRYPYGNYMFVRIGGVFLFSLLAPSLSLLVSWQLKVFFIPPQRYIRMYGSLFSSHSTLWDNVVVWLHGLFFLVCFCVMP